MWSFGSFPKLTIIFMRPLPPRLWSDAKSLIEWSSKKAEEHDSTEETRWNTNHLPKFLIKPDHVTLLWVLDVHITLQFWAVDNLGITRYQHLHFPKCIPVITCTWSIDWNHFIITHISPTEDVDTQYHLTLQMFFSYFFSLKAEVLHTRSITRTLPPGGWNNTLKITTQDTDLLYGYDMCLPGMTSIK